jgi:hypothetical protein
VALLFALPGLMSVIALIDSANPLYWRVSFAIISVIGAAVLLPVRGLPGTGMIRKLADVLAVILYVAIAVLGIMGGPAKERAAAVLLTALIFLGFNLAWMFLFAPLGDAKERREPPHARAEASTSSR